MLLLRGGLCCRCAKRYLAIWRDRRPDDEGHDHYPGAVLIMTSDGRFLWRGHRVDWGGM
jgi:hypothetical protein